MNEYLRYWLMFTVLYFDYYSVKMLTASRLKLNQTNWTANMRRFRFFLLKPMGTQLSEIPETTYRWIL